jgi:type II secretory pathway component PulF
MFFYNQFLATVRDESQQVTKRLVTASTLENAVLRLKMQKYRVLAIEPRKNPFLESLKKGKLEFGAAANKRDLATFSNNLALMGLVCRELANGLNTSFTTDGGISSETPQPVVL